MKSLFLIVVSLVIFVTGGCRDEPGNQHKSKWAYGMEAQTISGSVAKFRYTDIMEEPLEQPGISMSVEGGDTAGYNKPNGLGGVTWVNCNGEQHIESSGVTELGGWCISRGIRDKIDCKGYYVHSTLYVSTPCQENQDVKASHHYCTLRGVPNSGDWSTANGTMLCNTPVPASIESQSDQAAMMEQQIESGDLLFYTNDNQIELDYGPYTPRELDALTQPTIDPPSNGIEWTCTLVILGGNAGQYYYTEMDSFIAVNITDLNDYLRYSCPFMFSYIVKTAAPFDLDEAPIGTGTVKTDLESNGIPVNLAWYGSNNDQQTHVFRTSFFYPVRENMLVPDQVSLYNRFMPFADPNLWNPDQYDINVNPNWFDDCVDPNEWHDPNTYPVPLDPNSLFDPDCECMHLFINRLDTQNEQFMDVLIPERVMDVPTIPIAKDDGSLWIEFNDDDIETLVYAIQYWLSDNKIFDVNNDGVVNLKDINYSP